VTAAGTDHGGNGALVVPGRVPMGRLRAGARRAKSARRRSSRSWSDVYVLILAVVVIGAMAAGLARPLLRFVTGTGSAVTGAPGRLFVAAAILLLLGGLARLMSAAGPVTASSAFRFWLLAAPVRRRDLLRRRFAALVAVTAVAACVLAALLAHLASVTVLPVMAAAALATVSVTAMAVWDQTSEVAERGVHAVGRLLSAVSILGFGSLATGVGRHGADAALRVSPTVLVVLLAVLAVCALVTGWRAYRRLDLIEVSVLHRGQGLWTAGQAAAYSLDAFMLADFLAEQRARLTGRVRSAVMGRGFGRALARSEWTRLRRRPALAARIAVAAVVWWGCRPVLPAHVLSVVALVTGFCLVLPVSGTLKQVASSPGLRAQFAPMDKWLSRASAGTCLVAAAAWAAVVVPGLSMAGGPLVGVLIAAGTTAAVLRAVTRPPVDYSKPPVPTPFGDIPVDLFRQLFRGFLLLLVLIVVVARVR
jgi:Family of unknown function (DUF6297)